MRYIIAKSTPDNSIKNRSKDFATEDEAKKFLKSIYDEKLKIINDYKNNIDPNAYYNIKTEETDFCEDITVMDTHALYALFHTKDWTMMKWQETTKSNNEYILYEIQTID